MAQKSDGGLCQHFIKPSSTTCTRHKPLVENDGTPRCKWIQKTDGKPCLFRVKAPGQRCRTHQREEKGLPPITVKRERLNALANEIEMVVKRVEQLEKTLKKLNDEEDKKWLETVFPGSSSSISALILEPNLESQSESLKPSDS